MPDGKKTKAEERRELAEGVREKNLKLTDLSPEQLELLRASYEGKKRNKGKER